MDGMAMAQTAPLFVSIGIRILHMLNRNIPIIQYLIMRTTTLLAAVILGMGYLLMVRSNLILKISSSGSNIRRLTGGI